MSVLVPDASSDHRLRYEPGEEARSSMPAPGSEIGRNGQPSRPIGSGVQEVHDSHIVRVLDERDEMPARPGEVQVFRQIRVDRLPAPPATSPCRRRSRSYKRPCNARPQSGVREQVARQAVVYPTVSLGGAKESLKNPCRDSGIHGHSLISRSPKCFKQGAMGFFRGSPTGERATLGRCRRYDPVQPTACHIRAYRPVTFSGEAHPRPNSRE